MIIPAPLEDYPEDLIARLDTFRQLTPIPQIVEVDIVDGEFAPHLTIDTLQLAEIDTAPFEIDVHLMVIEPTDYVHEIRHGADHGQKIRTVIAQVERLHSLKEFVEEVQANKFQVGFALDLYTPVEAIDLELLPDVNLISVLGGKAGEQGQEFQPVVLEKIRELAELKREGGYSFEIRVDVGMGADTIPVVKAAGAESFAVGSELKTVTQEEQQEKWKLLQAVQE